MQKFCRRCKKEFFKREDEGNYSFKKRAFCCRACLYPRVTLVCENCGKEFTRKASHAEAKTTKHCSTKCHYARRRGKSFNGTGDKSHRWKGGKKLTSSGYYQIYCLDHPRAHKQSGRSAYVLEHILIAEKHIGRFLVKGEVVHHINGDKIDNRPENLFVFKSGGDHISFHHSVSRGEVKEELKSNLL